MPAAIIITCQRENDTRMSCEVLAATRLCVKVCAHLQPVPGTCASLGEGGHVLPFLQLPGGSGENAPALAPRRASRT